MYKFTFYGALLASVMIGSSALADCVLDINADTNVYCAYGETLNTDTTQIRGCEETGYCQTGLRSYDPTKRVVNIEVNIQGGIKTVNFVVYCVAPGVTTGTTSTGVFSSSGPQPITYNCKKQ